MADFEKEILFDSVNGLGHHFAEAIDITRRGGGGLEKIAGATHPEVQRFLRTLKPDPALQYVLMTPMGSFEYYGMNSNGDIFPETGLAFDRTKDDPGPVIQKLAEKWLAPFGKTLPAGANYSGFGFRSFLDAKRYQHHQNKQPELAFGDIVLAIWNPLMHRCEVIARHFREKAKQVGAEEIISDLDQGKARQISMGARVSFDVCTICGHISRTTKDYCDHLATAMGTVLADGRVVGAVNLFPRFFDLSDVFIPAAKESGVLQKVAHATRGPTKLATQRKVAEIKKEVLPNSGYRALQETCAAEPDLPRPLLQSGDFATLLSTLAALGIVMKPREFQDGMLTRAGQGDLADDLWNSHQAFEPTSTGGGPVALSEPDLDLANRLSDFIPARSGFYPHLPQRMLRVVVINMRPGPATTKAPDMPVLKKVAAAYDTYRKSLVALPSLVDLAYERSPEYYNEHFFQDIVVDSLQKHASFHSMDLSTPLVPLYVYNAHRHQIATPPIAWDFQVPQYSPARALISPVL